MHPFGWQNTFVLDSFHRRTWNFIFRFVYSSDMYPTFVNKHMHTGWPWHVFLYVCSKQASYIPGFMQNTWNFFAWYSAGFSIATTNSMGARVTSSIKKLFVSRSTVFLLKMTHHHHHHHMQSQITAWPCQTNHIHGMCSWPLVLKTSTNSRIF